ncbi:hypothetical protein CcI49_17435 [Frankia sp. CcI49]|uniref:hypothetical protein n=1 Tax=unclassified Frankia TaxID=2632575 RepID=UPI0006C9FCFA|nr:MULTISPECIES: hypothetical protein [unclassified Frankia]KPM51618.1 hypothetical protein ACG83_32715 [Frankia sp. R43]ONH59241.1 hypothetical protein CcI49_17435 [Frankia sp. CcI49]
MPLVGSAASETRLRLRTAAASVLFLLTTAACGDDGTGGGIADIPRRTGPIAAKDYVLTEGPETTGLTAAPTEHMDDPGDDSPLNMFDKDLAACLGVTPDTLSPTSADEAHSDTFTSEATSERGEKQSLEIGSLAGIYTADQVQAVTAALRHPDYLSCQNKTMSDDGDDPMRELPTPDGALSAYRVTFTADSTMDVIHLGGGRVFATLVVAADGRTPDADLEARLVKQLAAKLERQ